MNPSLVADTLTYSVRDRILVRNASLALWPGAITVIVGPNGAGKSTLLKMLSGELPASAGTIVYGSEPVGQLPAWHLACRRAVMAQAGRIAFPFQVYEVVRLALDGIGRALAPQKAAEIVAASLQKADVLHLAARQFQTLSGGEQQRVQFARVLCQLEAGRSISPHQQILFLDEPVASLDLSHQLALMDAARDIAASGAVVLAILHDLNLAVTFADHLVVMGRGQIVAQGAPAQILDNALVRNVFNVDLRMSRVPAGNLPFILPQDYPGHRR